MKFENSMTNVAYEVLVEKNRGLAFNELWSAVCQILKVEGDDAINLISNFYTQLTLDGRFLLVEGAIWDLRENHKYEEYSKDTFEYADDGDAEEEEIVEEDLDYGYDSDDEDEEDSDDEEDDGYNDSDEESY